MPTWTSRGLLFGALLLAGCGGIGPIGGPPPVREVAVTRDAVTITGPAGFCVDPDSLSDSEATAFVLMGNCAVISNRRSAGEAETVDVLDSFHQGDIYYLRARDSSASDIQNVASDYWRSYLDIGDQIATLTVLAREDEPISPEEGLATLRQFTQAVVAANPEDGTGPAPAAQPDPAPGTGGTLWNIGLFRRIMGG